MGVTHIDQLSDEERARFNEWADKWIEIGLRTGPADRARFEAAVKACYGFAGIEWPGVVVWVPSPLVIALAAPTTALVIEAVKAAQRAPLARVEDRHKKTGRFQSIRAAVDDAVDAAVGGAVRAAVDDAVGGAVRAAVDAAVGGAVRGAVGGAVDDAVRGAVGAAVDDAVDAAVRNVIGRSWPNYIGGQFWSGGYWWGGAFTSFFREICKLKLKGDLWDRGRAYEATVESACWWWPHRHFVMVCERPTVIHRELVNSAMPRGQDSHRLHCENGPAVAWPDSWGVWAIHGVRVSQQVVEAPHTLTAVQIRDEQNTEVRRVMLERFGFDRFINAIGALPQHADECGTLYRVELPNDEPLVMVSVLNSTLEPDGSRKPYILRVPPDVQTAREALAWTFNQQVDQYQPAIET